MAEFLRYALTESNAVANILFDKKRLLLIVIKGSHLRMRQFRSYFHDNRRGINHHGNKSLRITVDGRSRSLSALGLRYIKYLFDIVGNARSSVRLCVLNGFKDRDALCALIDRYLFLNPVTEVFKLGCFGVLTVNKQSVCGGIAVEPCLCIKKAPELFAVLHDSGCRFVNQLINGVLFCLLLCFPFFGGKLRLLIAALIRFEIIRHCRLPRFVFISVFLFLGLLMGGLIGAVLGLGFFSRFIKVGAVCFFFRFSLCLIPFELLTDGRFFFG